VLLCVADMVPLAELDGLVLGVVIVNSVFGTKLLLVMLCFFVVVTVLNVVTVEMSSGRRELRGAPLLISG